MTKTETAGVLALLREYYPRDIASTDYKAKVKAWYLVLADYPFEAVKAAAVAFASHDTKGFMPSPGQLVEELHRFDHADEMTAQEAWVLVSKAVRSLDWFAPEKQFEKLPELAKRAVGSPSVLKEWGMSDESAFETVIYSQFLKAYNVYQKREKELAALPSDVRKMLADVSGRLALTE